MLASATSPIVTRYASRIPALLIPLFVVSFMPPFVTIKECGKCCECCGMCTDSVIGLVHPLVIARPLIPGANG